jgi:hypothetical protein
MVKRAVAVGEAMVGHGKAAASKRDLKIFR